MKLLGELLDGLREFIDSVGKLANVGVSGPSQLIRFVRCVLCREQKADIRHGAHFHRGIRTLSVATQ